MKRITQRVVSAVFTAWLILAFPAQATPIPMGANPGDGFIFNFDFTGQVPAPPYSSINLNLGLSGLDTAGELLMRDYFDGLDGTGALLNTSFVGTAGANITGAGQTFFTFPGLNDGIFSVGIRMTNGDADLTFIRATGAITGAASVTIPGATASATVPEPASLVLLGLGLAGLSFTRRKQ